MNKREGEEMKGKPAGLTLLPAKVFPTLAQLINSFDVPETAAAELPALRHSPCHAEGDGWVSPSALKLSLRPGQ